MKVQQFTDFVSIEKMKRKSSQNKASKWFDDWFYSSKASYKYWQLSTLIAIWFYEWWLNNDKNRMND